MPSPRMVSATSAASHARVPSGGSRYAAISARAGTCSRISTRRWVPMMSGSEPSGGGALPSWDGMEPKYFSTQPSACSGLISPTIARTALFGA